MIDSEFPHRWHVQIPDTDLDQIVRLGLGGQATIRTVRLAALNLYFRSAGFNTVPLPEHVNGFIARHTSPHAMLMMDLRRNDISIPYTVTEL